MNRPLMQLLKWTDHLCNWSDGHAIDAADQIHMLLRQMITCTCNYSYNCSNNCGCFLCKKCKHQEDMSNTKAADMWILSSLTRSVPGYELPPSVRQRSLAGWLASTWRSLLWSASWFPSSHLEQHMPGEERTTTSCIKLHVPNVFLWGSYYILSCRFWTCVYCSGYNTQSMTGEHYLQMSSVHFKCTFQDNYIAWKYSFQTTYLKRVIIFKMHKCDCRYDE